MLAKNVMLNNGGQVLEYLWTLLGKYEVSIISPIYNECMLVIVDVSMHLPVLAYCPVNILISVNFLEWVE